MCRPALLLIIAASFLRAQDPASAAEILAQVRAVELDPEQCYLVRDLSLPKEDIKLYFNNGYLIFSKPVAGERIAAVFTGGADDPEMADGEILVMPPDSGERQSLAKYTGSPNLSEHFGTGLITFGDRSAQGLLDEIAAGGRGRPCNGLGSSIAQQWNGVLGNFADSFAQRLVSDLLSPARPGGGFLFLALSGKRLGNFEVVYDPLSSDQILVGSFKERGLQYAYDVWTSFPARSVRLGTAPRPAASYSISRYVIEASLDHNLWLKANTRASLAIGDTPVRSMLFAVSRAERVTAVRVDGMDAEILFQDSLRTRALRPDENDVFLIVPPAVLAPGSKHEVEFEHEGAVIEDRGSGVYAVNARSNWYPFISLEFALYELEFRYPKELMLVTAGEVVDDRTEGEWRITRRRTQAPIRVAGFNLGNYERITDSNQGLTVDVYGNRGLDPALAPRPQTVVITQRVRPLFRGARPVDETRTIVQTPVPPDPLARLEAVAADVSQSLEYFTTLFGPPALNTLTVSPMPGTAGQGFPGLIYLSTLSYLDPQQRPELARDPRQRTFFMDLMVAHEVAHQWWGNVVTPKSYQDDWLMEALSHYSALLWIEKKKGPEALHDVLHDFQLDLLKEGADGATPESFGPLTWGYRLESAPNPDTWRVITYEKGAWVIHMLRQRLGDERFFAMLAELRRRFELGAISTDDLRMLVQEFLPPRGAAASAEVFFDTWVYSTGIPSVRVRHSTSGRAPSVRVTGTVEQRDVPDDYSVEVPVEVQLASGATQVIWVRTGKNPAPFSATVPQPPVRVSVPQVGILIRSTNP